MFLSADKAEEVLRKVVQVREEINRYYIAPDRPDLPIETFQDVIAKMCGISIEKHVVDFEANFLQGLFERHKDKAVIYVRKSMPSNYVRFTAVKELCHILVDERGDWTTDGAETIAGLLEEFFFSNDEDDDLENPIEAKTPTQSELFAEIAAIELLYPRLFRSADKEKLSKGEVTLSQIASYHQVPEYVIDRALSEAHENALAPIWERVMNKADIAG